MCAAGANHLELSRRIRVVRRVNGWRQGPSCAWMLSRLGGGLPTGSVLRLNSRNRGKWVWKRKEETYEYNKPIYMGAEAAMSDALAGASRPNGVKRLFIVLCAPLLFVVLFCGRHYVF